MNAETVIVGSGVAAAALAQRMLEARPDAAITILEAGGSVKMKDFALYQNYVATGGLPYQEYYDYPPPSRGTPGENLFTGNTAMELAGSRLMMYGGTTVHWDGYSFRFKPEDFHLHTNTGQGIDWPFPYETLEPYYGQAEQYLGVSGDSNDPSVPRSAGYPFPAFPYSAEDTLAIGAFEALDLQYSHLPIARYGVASSTTNFAPCQTTGVCLYCPFGARYNAANNLSDLEKHHAYPNLSIHTDMVVESLIMGSASRATGVRVFDKTKNEHITVEAETVVIASGTIESPKLLLRSVTPDWEHGVGNQNDLVGRNIVTHPWITYTATLPSNPLHLQPEMAFPTLVSRHYDSEEEQSNGKFIMVNPPTTPEVSIKDAMQHGKTAVEIDEMVGGSTTIEFNAMFEVFSKAEYRVQNLDRISHLGMVETVLNFDVDDQINAQFARVQDVVEGVFAEMGATGTVTSDPSWGAHHAVCTTRMSDDPTLGVVDADMRVHDVENVYVCSNASFSTLAAVNPTLTLVALSLRLGDHLSPGVPSATSEVLEPAS